MGLEANKNVVKEWLRALGEGRLDDAEKLFADDTQWWVVDAGDVDMSYVKGFWTSAFATPPGPDYVKIVAMTAEDDRVALEMTINLKLSDGRNYRNRFHMLFYVRDGQVYKVREYLDTAYTRSFLGAMADHQAQLAQHQSAGKAH